VKTNMLFRTYFAEEFLECEMFQTTVVETSKPHILYSIILCWMLSYAGRCMLKKTGRTRPKIQTNVLAYGQKIGPVNAQQTGTI